MTAFIIIKNGTASLSDGETVTPYETLVGAFEAFEATKDKSLFKEDAMREENYWPAAGENDNLPKQSWFREYVTLDVVLFMATVLAGTWGVFKLLEMAYVMGAGL